MSRVDAVLGELKHEYCELHTRREDLFWTTKMGLADDPVSARAEAADAEKAWHRFLQDPERLAHLRRIGEDGGGTAAERHTLGGWISMLAAHVVESREGRKISEELVEREAELERRRQAMELGYTDPETGTFVPASSVRLRLLVRAHPNEAVRRAAFEGLRSIEAFVLDQEFLTLVKKRNELGKLLGYEDYYDWRVSVVESIRKERLFEILDDLDRRTAERTEHAVRSFAAHHGARALEPWNFDFLREGNLTGELDPYFGFGPALSRWMRTFSALGVRYRDAVLTLDLVDRTGKYENGFMHGPEPAFFDDGAWRAARINFAANAVVGQPGAGLRATETLFHEGGHAAHFANILADAPCFSQEFAPTSVAYAETQSMFMDSLLDDADWRVRYATDDDGRPIPLELVEAALRERQPFLGWEQRAMLTIPFAERALYELDADELTRDRVLETFRRVERELQYLGAGVRPVLSVPHLLAGESSAYYHGYVMAEMAVHQSREHFLERDGHLVDNPRLGRDLAAHYWAPGNSASYDDTLRSLTGLPLSADALVRSCNAEPDDAVRAARRAVERLATIPVPDAPIELDATIRVVHGRELVASTEQGGYEAAAEDFDKWIRKLESASS